MYSKSGYEEMSGTDKLVHFASDVVGKVLRTGRVRGEQVSDQKKLAVLEEIVTKIEEAKGDDAAIRTFLESVGKGLQKPGEFVNDNAGGPLSPNAEDIVRTPSGTIAPKLT